MLGYMTAKEARSHGFTHHGSYFGIPVWVGNPERADDVGGVMIATKWAPMEYLMTVFHYIEGFMRAVLFPDAEPRFQFQVGPEITP
jgi:hypothetical protein